MSSGADRFNVFGFELRAVDERVERVVLGPRTTGWSLEDCSAAPVERNELADLPPCPLAPAIESGERDGGEKMDSISGIYTSGEHDRKMPSRSGLMVSNCWNSGAVKLQAKCVSYD